MNDNIKEIGLILGIAIAIGYVILAPDPDAIPTEKVPSMENFDDHPISAWAAFDGRGGPCVKVRYDIKRDNTKLYMFNENGKLIHMTPLSLDPFKDGRRRVETYTWRLYRTEWSSDVIPGIYTIVVGTVSDRRGIGTEIEVL